MGLIRREAVIGMSLVGLIGGGEAVAQSVCDALKVKFAAKAAFLTAKCEFRALKKGIAVDPECLAKAEAFLTKKWEKAVAKGDCTSTVPQSAIQANIDGCVDTLVEDIVVATPTPTASATATPDPDGPVCCGGVVLDQDPLYEVFCLSAQTAQDCLDAGGTVGAPGTVCGASSCVEPPGFGGCCGSFAGSCSTLSVLICDRLESDFPGTYFYTSDYCTPSGCSGGIPPTPTPCVPDCTGRNCGTNGCLGSCGTCPVGIPCLLDTGTCCVPDCTGRNCGDDGCGGSCGTCSSGSQCLPSGLCCFTTGQPCNFIDSLCCSGDCIDRSLPGAGTCR